MAVHRSEPKPRLTGSLVTPRSARPERPVLKGTLAEAMRRAAAPAVGDVALGGARRPEVLTVGGLKVEMGPKSRRIDLENGAVGVVDATMRGFWHLSEAKVDKFVDDKVTGAASNLGPGTYVGYGSLSGDKVGHLGESAHYRHDLVLYGNWLLVPMAQREDAAWEVTELTDPEAEYRRMAPGKRINSYLRHPLKGVQFDGFVCYSPARADGSGIAAEGVVFHPEGTIQVTGQTLIDPTRPS